MKFRIPGVAVAVLVVLGIGAPVPASAHHAFGVEFDGSKCMDLKGTLSGIQWENPHAYLDIDVTDESGKVATWHLEMITPNALKRNGTLRQDFVANMGKTAFARVCPARAGAGENRGAASFIKLADGLVRIVGQNSERNITPDNLNF